MTTIARLNVLLSLSSRGFVGGLNVARKGLARFDSFLMGSLGNVLKWGGSLGTLAAGGGGLYLFQQQLEKLDETAKLADRLGANTKNLMGIQHGAGLAGVATEELNKNLQFMVKTLAEASQGRGEAISALERLGLDPRALKELDPINALMEIGDALGDVENQVDKVGIAMKVFGDGGGGMVNLLSSGSEGLRAMIAEAERLGLTFDRVELAGVEEANDALARLKATIGGVAARVAVELAPAIEDLGNTAAEAVAGIGDEITVLADALAHDFPLLMEFLSKQVQALAEDAGPGVRAQVVDAVAGLNNSLVPGSGEPLRGWTDMIFGEDNPEFGTVADTLQAQADAIFAELQRNQQARAAARAAKDVGNNGDLQSAEEMLALLDAQTKAMQEQAELLEEQNRQYEERKQRAASLIDSLKTPFEKMQDDVREFGELSGAGLLDEESLNRFSERIKQQLMDGNKLDVNSAVASLAGPGTIERGSTEDLRSLNRRSFEAQARKKLEGLATQQLETARDQWRELQKIYQQTKAMAEALREQQGVDIA